MDPRAVLRWILDGDFDKYFPCRQVYGICFNYNNEILVIKGPDTNNWLIPGGTPEEGEGYEETLIRELLEEADVKIKNLIPLGVQEVNFPDNPNRVDGDLFYQMRMVCEVDKLLPQTVDPAQGFVFERKFVPMEEITDWVRWGKLGGVMFADAIKVWKQNR